MEDALSQAPPTLKKASISGVVDWARSVASYNRARDPDKLLEEMYQNQFKTFEEYYEPLLGSLETEVESTELIDEAQARAATLNADSQAATQRALTRTGASLTPAQARQMERNRRTNVSIGESVSVNQARQAQQGIREGAINDLMSTASALQSGSTDALARVSQNKYQREAAYEAANSGLMSNILGTAGAIGGFMIGGPAGAAVGGAIGGTVGGRI